MRTAVSTITYMRNLFPEDCFQDNKLTGITIKTLLPKKPEARLLINWLEKGVFDALDKQYLTDVIFAIYTRNSDRNTLLECYQFHMDYPAPVPPAGAQTEGQGGGAGAAGDINSPAPIPSEFYSIQSGGPPHLQPSHDALACLPTLIQPLNSLSCPSHPRPPPSPSAQR